MYLVAIAWLYVAVMMAIAEATHSQGSLLGAVITLLLYGILPLALVLYVMGTPMRRRQRLLEEQREAQAANPDSVEVPDAGRQSPADPVQNR
jgi:NADH:ubiquinone oxidoreductase subunit 6 (subunit J)